MRGTKHSSQASSVTPSGRAEPFVQEPDPYPTLKQIPVEKNRYFLIMKIRTTVVINGQEMNFQDAESGVVGYVAVTKDYQKAFDLANGITDLIKEVETV